MGTKLEVMGKSCPACNSKNANDATVCAACGQPLVELLPALITEPVPDDLLKSDIPHHRLDVSSLDPDIVALVVAGHEQPIMVKGSKNLILGRYTPGEAAPSVDLTPFDASVLGVSRQHARIIRLKQGLAVEDMGSTNGTRVNRSRLNPYTAFTLRSGDMIQVGQLALFVYFNGGDTSQETITLKSIVGAGSFRLTPQFLMTHVSPFLSALAGVQAICDEIQGRRAGDIDIDLISSDPQNSIVSIRLDRAAEAVTLVKGPLAAWRKENTNSIALLLELKGSVKSTARLDGETVAETDVKGDRLAEQARTLARELRESVQRVGLAFMTELAPQRSESDRKDDLERLMPHLNVLAFSNLYITSDL